MGTKIKIECRAVGTKIKRDYGFLKCFYAHSENVNHFAEIESVWQFRVMHFLYVFVEKKNFYRIIFFTSKILWVSYQLA